MLKGAIALRALKREKTMPFDEMRTVRVVLAMATIVLGLHGCGSSLEPESVANLTHVTFENVTAKAGLVYDNPALTPGHPDYCQWMTRYAGGAVAADFDGDGWTDLFFTRLELPNLLFRNRGDGTFEEVGATAGVNLVAQSSACAAADVNNDGSTDIYVLTLGERNYLYMNDGHGSFVEQAESFGLAMEASSLPRERTGASFGDYDRDGDLDLVVTEWRAGGVNRLLRNDGGAFVDATQAAGLDLSALMGFTSRFNDIDGDGWPDLLIVGDFETSKLYRNLRNGRFEEITASARVGTEDFGMGSAVGDVNNDGAPDWFVTSIYRSWFGGDGNRLYVNDGAGVFTDGTDRFGVRNGGFGWGASFFDFDNDGYLDLGMANGVRYPCFDIGWQFNHDGLRLWKNLGGERMAHVANDIGLRGTESGKGFLSFDFDNDGDLDVLVTNNDAPPALFENHGGNSSNWLRIELRGRLSNSFGVGARIVLTSDSGAQIQTREVSASSNFMSQDEVIVHFGLGAADRVDTLTIDWPATNCSQVLENVSSNQLLIVNEPDECAAERQ